MSQAGLVDVEASHPQIPTQFDADAGSAVPLANVLEVAGGAGVDTSAAGNTVTISLSGGGAGIDSFSPDSGTDPVVPDGAGLVSMIGDGTTATTVGGANQLTIGATTNFETTGMHGWNGSVLETVDVNVTSNGAVITLDVSQSGGGDLTLVWSDGFETWDTTPADTVALTAGTDVAPTLNYIYYLKSTSTLTTSIVGWPATEHAPIATVLCQSAASLQTDGAYKVHVWTDHVVASDNQGHVGDLNYWIRQQNATWQSGVGQTFTITANGGAADNVILTTAAGVVLQLHTHAFPAFAGTPDVYVVNDNATPYTKITDLNAALTDSTGASMAGKYFSLVIWGVVSEDAADCKLMLNLPSGSYNNATSVTADPNAYADFSIPAAFKGTGFLIAKWNLRHQAAASGTWTSINEIDLRGNDPDIEVGGSTAIPNEFIDNVFRILDDGDNTRELAFQVSGVTTATTRTLTIPDADGTITLGSAFTTNGVAYASNTTTIATTAELSDGQLAIGSTGNPPVPASLTAPAAGFTITGGAGTVTFALADDLAAVEGLATTGLVTRTGASTWAATTITDNAFIIGDAGELVQMVGPLTNGQLMMGSTGATPVAATLTDGTGISTTVGAGSITINAVGGGLTWRVETGAASALVASEGVIANRGTLVTLTLPAASLGDVFRIVNVGAGFVKIGQNASDQIRFGTSTTTVGVGGDLTCTALGDSIEIVAQAANTFLVLSSVGNWTVT